MLLLWMGIVLGLLVGAAALAGKHRTVKAIDVAGLNFLTPVVRLCYGEEPRKQLREIGRFIVVPVCAILVFLVAWQVVSEHIQTKSGKLPNPYETWQSATAVWAFHTRENDKQRAFNLDGEQRESELQRIESRLSALEPLQTEADAQVKEAREQAAVAMQERLAPLQQQYEKLSADSKAAKKQRDAELKTLATEAAAGDVEVKNAYVGKVRAYRQLASDERDALRELRAEITALRGVKDPEVVRTLEVQTAIAEERQYLDKMRDQLTESNRYTKVAKENEKLIAAREKMSNADAGGMLQAATAVARTEDRIEKIEESGYAKPATLPYQIKRSVLCVFTGFLLGSAIAIPLGVLCGLSKTFMAAMTPFIAIFKPVSPIVWLPVALIIASSFIPDPDKHWFTQWMWELPWLGEYKINPAFLASAVTVALCSLWATMVNTAFGVASVEKDHINVARVLRLGFWDRLFKIVLPSSLPLVFAGLRISLGVGWMVLIAAELLSSSEGIGKFVWDQFNNGASDSFAKMVVVVFVVGVIGLALDRMMIVFQRLVSFDGAPTAI